MENSWLHFNYRNAMYNDAPDTKPVPVVFLGGASVGVPGKVLEILERYFLARQVRDHQDPEGVGREDLRQRHRANPGLEARVPDP